MGVKQRYLICSQHRLPLTQEPFRALRNLSPESEAPDVLRHSPLGHCVVQLTDQHVSQLSLWRPDLIIEPDMPLRLYGMPGIPPVAPAERQYALPVQVTSSNGEPIPDVTLYGVTSNVTYRADTGPDGTAVLNSAESQLLHLVASPRDTYWSRVIPNVLLDGAAGPLRIELTRLEVTGTYSWGHCLMGFPAVNSLWTGQGINIAVIDSGITDQHKDLQPAGGFNEVVGEDPAAWNNDLKGHGTHCSGIVAGLNNRIGVLGGAPSANVYALRVFPGGYTSELVHAVELSIASGMDIITMSLGGALPSTVLALALSEAYARGITCIAAAGNDRTHVAYPAAFPTVIGVTAIGRFGTFPTESGHALRIGDFYDWRGELFSARFNNFGPEVAVCAPGIAILSTVPSGYASWDGTSMACPYVTALTALILEAYPQIRTSDARQPEMVRQLLQNACVDLGMPPYLQGYGLPVATRILAPG